MYRNCKRRNFGWTLADRSSLGVCRKPMKQQRGILVPSSSDHLQKRTIPAGAARPMCLVPVEFPRQPPNEPCVTASFKATRSPCHHRVRPAIAAMPIPSPAFGRVKRIDFSLGWSVISARGARSISVQSHSPLPHLSTDVSRPIRIRI
jgi:hypothetical protein